MMNLFYITYWMEIFIMAASPQWLPETLNLPQLCIHRKKQSFFLVTELRQANPLYSGTPLNGHPWKADSHDIMDNSESPDCPSIHVNT